jgi:8-amino-7-oxononanoate synthase
MIKIKAQKLNINMTKQDIFKELTNNIKNLKDKNLYRDLEKSESTSEIIIKRNNQQYISFACNDYLGLSHNFWVKKSAIEAIKKYGVGSRASRFITGNNILYEKLEKKIAQFYQADSSIIFSSGYSTAIGIIPALVGEGDLVVADKLIHSCLLDGIKLSMAKLIRFNHNDINHCEKILTENYQKYQKILIISENIFSMDGDCGKIDELLKLSKKYSAVLLTDDAHGVKNNLVKDKLHIQMGTLSKGFGGLGGFVVGNKIIIEYLLQFAKSLKYSTALPPAILASSLQAFKLAKNQKLAEKSLANAQYFCQLMNMPKPQSSIVVIIIGDDKKTLLIAKKILANGYIVGAIRYPTVPKNSSRLRLTFSSSHQKKHIKKFAEIIKNILKI